MNGSVRVAAVGDLHCKRTSPGSFHRRVLRELTAAGIDFLVGGGYALERYLGIGRLVKDLDLFLRAADVQKALDHLGARLGCDTELTFPHWLGKVRKRGDHVDLIFNAGNGVCVVEDDWFNYAVPSRVLDVPVLLCPVEGRGTLTSRAQYLVDLELWGYEDARLAPHGSMSEEDASIWTADIDAEASRPLGERPREAAVPNDLPIGGPTHGSM